jgi:hypothetical protein
MKFQKLLEISLLFNFVIYSIYPLNTKINPNYWDYFTKEKNAPYASCGDHVCPTGRPSFCPSICQSVRLSVTINNTILLRILM